MDTAGSSESQPIEAQDALETREEHLHFLRFRREVSTL